MFQSKTEHSGAIVRFDAVGLRYGHAPAIFNNLSFELPVGSFHFLTGASGIGKSLLFRLISLGQRPVSGRINLFGHDPWALSRDHQAALRRRIGAATPQTRLLNHLNVLENAALPLRLTGTLAKGWRADVEELLAWVGLGRHMNAYPETLSGGERRRLSLARAVVAKPDLILVDDLDGGLDPASVQRLVRLLLELNRQGVTVLAVAQDDVMAERLGKPRLRLDVGGLIS